MSFFTHIIITAPTKEIATLYQSQCDQLRLHDENFESIHCFHDRVNLRGSFGGTISALSDLMLIIDTHDMQNAKVCIIHSGGESKRCPLHSISGKAWASINSSQSHDISDDIHTSTIAILMKELNRFFLNSNLDSGCCVVASSDVMLDIARRRSDGIVDIPANAVSVICVKEDVMIAKNHGVLVVDDSSSTSTSLSAAKVNQTARAKLYLQKPSVETMIGNGYTCSSSGPSSYADKHVLIDTGVVITTGIVYKLIIELITSNTFNIDNNQSNLRLELYTDYLLSFNVSSDENKLTFEQYMARLGLDARSKLEVDDNHRQALYHLWSTFNTYSLYCITVTDGLFYHMGTTSELLSFVTSNSSNISSSNSTSTDSGSSHSCSDRKLKQLSEKYNLKRNVHCNDNKITDHVYINTYLTRVGINEANSTSLGTAALVEHSLFDPSTTLANNTIVSSVIHILDKSTSLLENSMIQELPLLRTQDGNDTTSSRYVLLQLGICDDMKANYMSAKATVCGCSWQRFFELTGCSPDDIWDADVIECERTLWNANLYSVCIGNDSTEHSELWLQHLQHQTVSNISPNIPQWRQSHRLSISQIIKACDVDRLCTWRSFLSSAIDVSNSGSNIRHTDIVSAFDKIDLFRHRMRNNTAYAGSSYSCAMLSLWCYYLCSSDEFEADSDALPCNTQLFYTSFLACTDVSNAAMLTLSSFHRLWIACTTTNESLLVMHYLHSCCSKEDLVNSSSALLQWACINETNVSTENQPILMLILGWLLRSIESPLFTSEVYDGCDGQSSSDINYIARFNALVSQMKYTGSFNSVGTSADSIRNTIEIGVQKLMYRLIDASLNAQLMQMDGSSNISGSHTNAATSVSHISSPTDSHCLDRCVVVQAPVRIDLAGGWSDSPPICFRHASGGCVVNVGVTINSRYPIVCFSRFHSNPTIVLRPLNKECTIDALVCSKYSDFFDYNDTSSPYSLMKAVLIELSIIQLSSCRSNETIGDSDSIASMMHSTFGGYGIEIACGCDLLSGSGMGVSSILIGAVIKSVAALVNRTITDADIIYMVTRVEQLMSTGGGWQDQCGALTGTFKVSKSLGYLPLHVSVRPIETCAQFNDCFNGRTYALYTGSQRLAKNTLINALRNYSLTPMLQSDNTVTRLVNGATALTTVFDAAFLNTSTSATTTTTTTTAAATAATATAAASDEDKDDVVKYDEMIDSIALTLSEYWELKKIMGGSAVEPAFVAELFQSLLPIASGCSLCGAGAGGYAVVILKRNVTKQQLLHTIHEYNMIHNRQITVNDVMVDGKGIHATDISLSRDVELTSYIKELYQ